ncbi:hypothetical protein ND860_18685 [Leptospira levettii]|uniref:hypothetical protein n=1 Tax=Leptospira levettii TaxID=2023178 RepID=UPI00223CDF39|nr:hypothetical protein [Leptospira levettii]MCW7498569.1 hypothetical protein [Leptospira levettii]
MKPSYNAFLGYTYQKLITFLMIVKMDTEREILEIESETTLQNNFDDLTIKINNSNYFCQIKDIDSISLTELKIRNNQISIKGKKHILSKTKNLLFFKNIQIIPNTTIFGFQAYQTGNLWIISLSRQRAQSIINDHYEYNKKRYLRIVDFFNYKLDNRLLKIKQNDLPRIDIYDINLTEKTIYVGKKILEIEDILFIEGKPGVGKSHLVTCLSKTLERSLIYRFWVSNQDKDYSDRLIFQNFLTNISKEIFQDYRLRSEDEIIRQLKTKKQYFIIDGLDHVENYNPKELQAYFNFINKLSGKCKTIILSRPLMKTVCWKKQILSNWNLKETELVLNDFYYIQDKDVCKKIYNLTEGYPILVRFISENYKLYGEVTEYVKYKDIDDYYNSLINDHLLFNALFIFLSTRSYIMKSEISLFLENELSLIAKEFISKFPYLFEIRLNRITLLHDSFNQFLRNRKLDFIVRRNKIKNIVYQSLLNGEYRFMSRFRSFELNKIEKTQIVKKYTSIAYFKEISRNFIDIEALQNFYKSIRETLSELDPEDLNFVNFFDLALIINLTHRDHISTNNEFLYVFVKALEFNGYIDDDITSSGHLFCMYYFYKTKDHSLLYNLTSNENFSTSFFYENLSNIVRKEEAYFEIHRRSRINEKNLEIIFEPNHASDSFEIVPNLLANLYIHKTDNKTSKELIIAIDTYIEKDEYQGIFLLHKFLNKLKKVDLAFINLYLSRTKEILLSLGVEIPENEYYKLTLSDLIFKYSHLGSFTVLPKVLNYIRLSIYDERKIDIESINRLFLMYHNRKDYSVINIYEALFVFEKKDILTIGQSINIITSLQKMSEKGISFLLASYIELHSIEIIQYICDNYDFKLLQISWFHLSSHFIDSFPDYLFEYALFHQLLGRNNYEKEIEYSEVENLIYSNRRDELLNTLLKFQYKIKVPYNNSFKNELTKFNFPISTKHLNEEIEYRIDPEDQFYRGILDSNSISLIKAKNLKIEEVAGYSDGYYSVFSNLDIYKAFNKEEVENKAKEIFQNAILGKIKSIDFYANLFYFTGNFIKFADEYNINVSFRELYKSFQFFLEFSLVRSLSEEN